MSCTRTIAWTLVWVMFFFANTVLTNAQMSGLRDRIPYKANTLLIVNQESILQSPLAQKDGWGNKHEKAWEAGLTVLPPKATQFIMAMEMDLDFMQPIWEVMMAYVTDRPSLAETAARWGGTIDRIGNNNVVFLPDDTCVVEFNETKVGSMRPGSRQKVAQWLRETNTSSGLSPYLNKAFNYANKVGTPIVLAMDLRDVASKDEVTTKLKAMDAVKGKDVDIEQLASRIASIQGVTLGITINDRVHGAILVDFDQDISLIGDLAKPILLSVLVNQSAMIDEFAEWTATVEGKRIKLSGYLKRSGLQRIFSLLDTPASMRSYAPSPGDQPSDEAMAQIASQQYFKTVANYVDDLKEKPKQTFGQAGIWWGKYATKIDNLPLLNVDDELLNYGSYVSSCLRQGEETMRGVGGRQRVRTLNAPAQYQTAYSYGGSYGRWGRYGMGYGSVTYEDYKAEQIQQIAIRTEERVSGASSAREYMQNIQAATAKVRREMTQKYKVEF